MLQVCSSNVPGLSSTVIATVVLSPCPGLSRAPGYPEFADAPVAVDLRSSHGSDRISDAKLIILWLVRRKRDLRPDEIQ